MLVCWIAEYLQRERLFAERIQKAKKWQEDNSWEVSENLERWFKMLSIKIFAH